MDLGNTGNMQMEKANSEAQIVGTTYEYLDHIGEPIPMKKMVWKRFRNIIFGLIGLIISTPFIFVFGRLQKLIEFFGQVTKEDLEWRFPP